MGIVARQTIKNNLFAYLGVAFGTLAQIYIYPLDLEIKGFLDLIIKYAQLLLPFFVLGVNAVMLRFLPYSQNGRDQAAFQLFTRGMLIVSAVSVVLLLLNFSLGEVVIGWAKNQGFGAPKLLTYHTEIIIISIILAYGSIVTTHLVNFHRVAISVIFNSLFIKIGLPLTVLLHIGGWLTRHQSLWAVIGIFFFALVGLLAYTRRLHILRFEIGDLRLKEAVPRDMFNYAAFSFLGLAGSTFIIQFDVVMVGGFLGNEAAGVYTFSAFAAMVVGIPYKAINSISSPLVAKALKDDDLITIESLYQNASQVLFAIGGLVFTGMVVCLPYVYNFTESTSQYAVAYYATLILGLSQLFDQITSINATIFGQSKFFRWYITLMVTSALLNIGLNYYFIGILEMGYTGAAIATALSLCAFNIGKALFLAIKLGVHPFTWSVLYTTASLSCIGLLAYLIPDLFGNAYLDFTLKGCTIVGLFYLYVRYSNAIPPMKEILKGGLKKIFT